MYSGRREWLALARDLDQVAAGVVEHGCGHLAHSDGLLGEPRPEAAKSFELLAGVVEVL
jgi:hypothetical protein